MINIQELSTGLLARYKKAAGKQATAADKAGPSGAKQANKRFSGIVRATKKQFDNDKKKTNEEVEQIKELSEPLLRKYRFAAQRNKDKIDNTPAHSTRQKVDKYLSSKKREQGIKQASKKITAMKESVEYIQELKAGTLLRYSTKALKSASEHGIKAGRANDERSDQASFDHLRKSESRMTGYKKALGRLQTKRFTKN